jgi:predicted phosphate transport protein (TIGR00153 family)
MGLLKRMYPEEKDFYKMLFDQAEMAYKTIQQLQVYMETAQKEDGQTIITLEREGDELRRIIIDELNQTFITPFEREDIFGFSREIDDIIDACRSIYEEMQIFELEPTEQMRRMLTLIVEAIEKIYRGASNLKQHPAISLQHAIEAKKLQNKIEEEYRKEFAKLLNEEDMRYILKMREIFRHLSNLGDKVDSVADVIGHIVVKTS